MTCYLDLQIIETPKDKKSYLYISLAESFNPMEVARYLLIKSNTGIPRKSRS
jgi:hypothetical protein